MPRIKSLKIPTLVLYTDHDFIPAGTAEHIAQAMLAARMVTLKDRGHFSYLECPAAVREQVDIFFRGKGLSPALAVFALIYSICLSKLC